MVGLLLALSFVSQETATSALNRGITAYRETRYTEAVAALESAAQLAPREPQCQWSLGAAYMAQWIPGDPTAENAGYAARASSAFRRALELDPLNTTALGSLASIEFNSGRVAIGAPARSEHFKNAVELYRKLRELDPQDKSAFYPLGVIAWESRSLDDAIANLHRALILDPSYYVTTSYLNLALRARGTPEDLKLATQFTENARHLRAYRAQQTTPRITLFSKPGVKRQAGFRLDADAAEENIRQKPDLVFPGEARQAQVQGIVQFRVVIGKTGEVLEAKLVGGHPLLIPAATEAIGNFVYRPVILDGELVEITTLVDVDFILIQ